MKKTMVKFPKIDHLHKRLWMSQKIMMTPTAGFSIWISGTMNCRPPWHHVFSRSHSLQATINSLLNRFHPHLNRIPPIEVFGLGVCTSTNVNPIIASAFLQESEEFQGSLQCQPREIPQNHHTFALVGSPQKMGHVITPRW